MLEGQHKLEGDAAPSPFFVFGTLLEFLGRFQLGRECRMFASIRRDAFVGLPIDHIIVLETITRHSEQNDQPRDARKFLAQPPGELFDATGADMDVVRRRRCTT